MKTARSLAIVAAITFCVVAANSQSPSPTPLSADKQVKRDATRERVRTLLSNLPKDMPVTFRQSDKQPYNFTGYLKDPDLKNVDGFEVVVSVTADETVGFRIYPHYNNGYINIDKARNSAAIMRRLLNLSHHNFLYWGADDTGDVFAGYTFTLESGFPVEAMRVVLWSVKPLDQYVGQLRPSFDGSEAR
jgi:hypothetical protein